MKTEHMRGIRPREFVERVKDSGSVISNWPFGDLYSAEIFAEGYSWRAIDYLAPDNSRNIAIGRIIHERNQTSLRVFEIVHAYRSPESYGKKEDYVPTFRPVDYNLDFRLKRKEDAAWKQLDGVNVAVEVKLDSHTRGEPQFITDNYHRRVAEITHVYGIEQPMVSQDDKAYNPANFGGLESRYVQGTLVTKTKPAADFYAQLDLGVSDLPQAIVTGDYQTVQSDQLWPVHVRYRRGTELRARVRRNDAAPNLYHITEGPVVVLNRR